MNKTTFIKLSKKLAERETICYGGKLVNLGYYEWDGARCINYLHIINSACIYRIHIEDTEFNELAIKRTMLSDDNNGKYDFIDIDNL